MSASPRRLVIAVAAVLSAFAVLTACATPRATASASPTPPASTTPSATPTPSATTTETAPTEAAERVRAMSVRERLASLLIVHVAGTAPADLKAEVDRDHPGGVILMGDNVGATLADVTALTKAVQTTDPPMLMSVDQEGGMVARLPGDDFAAGDALAAAPVEATTEAFTKRAKLVAAAGLNTNFGIVADETADPDSFIASRVLGTDPAAAAARVTAAVQAERAVGVLSTLKHFPGHGAAPGDSHTSLPQTDLTYAAWAASDAVPFKAGIAAGAELVMLGHLVYSQVDAKPASLSPVWHRVLRDELGFTGLIVSDDMGMLENTGVPAYADRIENAVQALNAGTTMLLVVADGPTPVSTTALLDGLVTAVESGRLPEATVDAAATLAMQQRLDLAAR